MEGPGLHSVRNDKNILPILSHPWSRFLPEGRDGCRGWRRSPLSLARAPTLFGTGPQSLWRGPLPPLVQAPTLFGAGLFFGKGPAPLACTGSRFAVQVPTSFSDLRQTTGDPRRNNVIPRYSERAKTTSAPPHRLREGFCGRFAHSERAKTTSTLPHRLRESFPHWQPQPPRHPRPACGQTVGEGVVIKGLGKR